MTGGQRTTGRRVIDRCRPAGGMRPGAHAPPPGCPRVTRRQDRTGRRAVLLLAAAVGVGAALLVAITHYVMAPPPVATAPPGLPEPGGKGRGATGAPVVVEVFSDFLGALLPVLVGLVTFGAAFSAYLTWLQVGVVRAVCAWCAASALLWFALAACGGLLAAATP